MSTPVPALPPLEEDFSRVLAVAAHPDDLEYGVSAAVARWTAAGLAVSYLLVTRGEAGIETLDPAVAGPRREDEERRAAAVVGVDDVTFLDHPDGAVVEGLALRRDVARVIRRVRPELVVVTNHHDTFGPGAWNSAGHRAVGRSAIDAASDAGNRWIFTDLVDEGLVPWSPRRVAVASSPVPTHAVDVAATREAAVASLVAHHEYFAALDPRPGEEQARDILAATLPGDRLPLEVFG